MAFRFFNVIGSLFQKKQDDPVRTFSPKLDKDGALIVPHTGTNQSSSVPYYDGLIFNTERELIKKYRSMAMNSECKRAISEIVGDAIVYEENEYPVEINLDKLEHGEAESLKKKIKEEFAYICKLLNFRLDGDNIFEQWYVDGKLPYHMIIDPSNTKDGIKELRYIDPRQVQKVKEVSVEHDRDSGSETYKIEDEYYVYDPSGLFDENYIAQSVAGYTKISKKDIVYAHSGLIDEQSSKIISHLHQAIRPFNQLREMEDSLIIYRLARAPERRVFYIDVGSVQNNQIEQYMRNEMLKYKNDLTYNMDDGEISHRRRHMAMTEDFWIPRKEGSQATSIETLPGGQNLGQIEDIEYFKTKLYESLNVPITRLNPEAGFAMGRPSEISRSEVNFSRFNAKLRKQFANQLFTQILKTQLVLKEICSAEDFDTWEENIFYDFKTDSHFAELKDAEVWKERLALFEQFQPAMEAGFFTKKFIQEKILKITEEDLEDMQDDLDTGKDTTSSDEDSVETDPVDISSDDLDVPEDSEDTQEDDTETDDYTESYEVIEGEDFLIEEDDFKDLKIG